MTAVREALSGPRRQVVGFFRGLSLPFRGAKLVYVEHPDLMRYWLAPILVTIAALVASTAAVFHWDDTLIGWVWTEPSAADGWQGWLLGVAHDLFAFVIDAFLLLVALLITILAGSLVAAPFNARLAEVIDERITGQKPPAFALGRVLTDLLRTAAIEVGFAVANALLFVAGLLVPVAGPFLFVLGLVAWALYFAIAYVDVPLTTRGMSVTGRLAFSGANLLPVLGFGTGVGLFLIVPIVNLLFMPAAVAGGVLLVTEITRERA